MTKLYVTLKEFTYNNMHYQEGDNVTFGSDGAATYFINEGNIKFVNNLD